MGVFLTILQVLSALGLIFTILLQSGRSAGLAGSITGGAEALFGRKKGLDEFFHRVSIYLGAAFLLLTLLLSLV